jgi:chemotaxis protein MotB
MPTPPIIIIKKKGGHGGHHGGAWKVAYADFVTAMMALFIVLWLLSSSSKQTQLAISGYFKDPSGTATKPGSALAGTAENLNLTKQDMAQLKEKLQKTIQKINDLDKLKKNIEMTVTAEGLRIELIESEKGTFFESGSAQLNKNGQELLNLLAMELAKVPNHISIEGHTDAKPFAGKNSSYSNWELSSDRANAARRLMQSPEGLRVDQVTQVRGFADQRLRNPKDPLDPANRRVSIIVQYINSNSPSEEPVTGEAAKGEGVEEAKPSSDENKKEPGPAETDKQ